MQVHFQLEHLPAFRNAVLTIGTFDGVHTGHTAILDKVKSEALACNGETVVITFHPHPRRILCNADAPALLTSLEERIDRFNVIGIDHLVVVAFDPVFSSLSANAYIQEFLVNLFLPKVIVIGYDHRFGQGRMGDYELLKQMGAKFGYRVCEIPEKMLDASRVSSTHIRHALLGGDLATANSLLSYPYQLQGEVIEGDKLGRTLGFPTANLALNDSDKLIPSSGVYAVKVELNQKGMIRHETGMMNIGYRPTVNGRERRIEVHIFNFDEEIYHQTLKVALVAYTRKEMKFSGLETLKLQLKKDKVEIAALLTQLSKEG